MDGFIEDLWSEIEDVMCRNLNEKTTIFLQITPSL